MPIDGFSESLVELTGSVCVSKPLSLRLVAEHGRKARQHFQMHIDLLPRDHEGKKNVDWLIVDRFVVDGGFEDDERCHHLCTIEAAMWNSDAVT